MRPVPAPKQFKEFVGLPLFDKATLAGSLILLIQFTAENLNWHKEAKQEGLKIIFSSAFWH